MIFWVTFCRQTGLINFEDCYLQVETIMVDMICDINREYRNHVAHSHNGCRQYPCAKLKKVVYGTLMGVILF